MGTDIVTVAIEIPIVDTSSIGVGHRVGVGEIVWPLGVGRIIVFKVSMSIVAIVVNSDGISINCNGIPAKAGISVTDIDLHTVFLRFIVQGLGTLEGFVLANVSTVGEFVTITNHLIDVLGWLGSWTGSRGGNCDRSSDSWKGKGTLVESTCTGMKNYISNKLRTALTVLTVNGILSSVSRTISELPEDNIV